MTPVRDGVLAAIGGISSGWSLYVKDGRPTFYYNFFEVDHARVQSSETLPKGKSTRPRRDHAGRTWSRQARRQSSCWSTASRREAAASDRTVPFRYSVEPFDIGRDTVSPVSTDYKVAVRVPGPN